MADFVAWLFSNVPLSGTLSVVFLRVDLTHDKLECVMQLVTDATDWKHAHAARLQTLMATPGTTVRLAAMSGAKRLGRGCIKTLTIRSGPGRLDMFGRSEGHPSRILTL
jgi:hypothetical protein